MSAEVTTIDWGQTPSIKKSRKKSRKKLVRRSGKERERGQNFRGDLKLKA